MGRETRRVPLDFDWPQGETWEGYLMPDRLGERQCSDCRGTGTTPARQWVEQMAALCLLLDGDLHAQAQGRPMHPYFNDTGSRAWGVRPSADIREFGTGLAGREGFGGMHDSIDNWRATDKLIEAAGLDPKAWGMCAACAGHGSIEKHPGQRDEAEAWEPTEPPTGDGWQMWETTSEGSPMSPVFGTPEELADWLAESGASLFGGTTATREQWLKIVTGEDFAHLQIAPGVVMM